MIFFFQINVIFLWCETSKHILLICNERKKSDTFKKWKREEKSLSCEAVSRVVCDSCPEPCCADDRLQRFSATSCPHTPLFLSIEGSYFNASEGLWWPRVETHWLLTVCVCEEGFHQLYGFDDWGNQERTRTMISLFFLNPLLIRKYQFCRHK